MSGKKMLIGMVLVCLILSGLTSLGFSEGVRADTPVEGEILVDTTWTTASSPYLVTNDVTVGENATLTIESGVTVKFGGYCSIIVNGNLSAVGTTTNNILFTSNAPTPASGDWNTIKFMGDVNKTFTVKYCVFEYGANAVTISSKCVSVVENCDFHNNSGAGVYIIGEVDALIKDNTIHSNNYGISSEGSTVSGVNIEGNTITNNNLTAESHGIYLYASSGNAYMYDVAITGNTISFNGGSGIYLYASAYWSSYIYNINITGNTVSSNGGSGIYLYSYGWTTSLALPYAYIYDVTITGNTVSSNGGSGIYLYSYGWTISNTVDRAYMYDVAITGNTIFSNGGSGIYLYASAYYSYIYNVAIFGNIVSSNGGDSIYLYAHTYGSGNAYIYNVTISGNTVFLHSEAGIKTYAKNHYSDVTFDLAMQDNLLSANKQGILVSGGANANITNNSIAYNDEHGILFDTCTGNAAHYNDIYRNLFGMNISNGATGNAENNYWGDASGPYHSTMNYNGMGNPVNGIGTDLDFMPYLTTPVGVINQRPTAYLTADKTSVVQNENINFDATGSTDDNNVESYFFDFDDGTNTGWITASTTTHSYSSEGIYNVTVVVRDEYGVKSNNTAKKTITVSMSAGITSHDLIRIYSNSDFTTENGVINGTGTADNPYIISGWDIDATTGYGIIVEDTTAYFIIKNCVIHDGMIGGSAFWGIKFSSVQNSVIDNVTFYNNNHAISTDGSSNNNQITNCDIYSNTYGICLDSSSDNIISNCDVYSNSYGIGLQGSDNNQIISCNVYNNSYFGINLDSSNYNQITNCEVYNNPLYGICLLKSSNNEIHYNNIYDNTNCGVYNWNSESQYQVNATNNWWGSADGPGGVGPGTGNAVSGNVLYEPWTGAPSGDTTPPTITHTPVTTAIEGENITVTATITDDVGVTSATLYYRKTGETIYTSIAMSKSGNTYTASIPASVVTTAGVEYYISATDGINTATDPATNPETSPHSVTVLRQTIIIIQEITITIVYHCTQVVIIRNATPDEIAVPVSEIPVEKKYIHIFIDISTNGTLHDAFITIKYKDSDVVGIDENRLRMYCYLSDPGEFDPGEYDPGEFSPGEFGPGEYSGWVKIKDSGVWTNNNTVWARTEHFTIFAPMAEKSAAAGEEGGAISWILYTGVAVIAIIILISVSFMVKRKKGKEKGISAKPSEIPPEQPSVPSVSPKPQPSQPSKPTMIRCPKCKETFQVSGERPLTIVCPKCGAKGTLR